MADIVVLYLSQDEQVVEKLVTILRRHWTVWWSKDIAQGDWEQQVRTEIGAAQAVVAVLSDHAKGNRIGILRDEIDFAQKKGKGIFPFLIGEPDVPFGIGRLNRTNAPGWRGDPNQPAVKELIRKLGAGIQPDANSGGLARPTEVEVRGKKLRLPAFAFSISSHETPIKPKDGVELLSRLPPEACLISAYDHWKYYQRHTHFRKSFERLAKSRCVVFLDSGNYESYRKNDRYSKKRNPNGWKREEFIRSAKRLASDAVFSFDTILDTESSTTALKNVISGFRKDDHALDERKFELCPIVHLPKNSKGHKAEEAPKILAEVAHTLEPLFVAIPERELGEGLLQRVLTVKAIRTELNKLDRYYLLHLLGTGNPLSMIALAVAGADSFDGLEWCRTVSDYESGFLFHFQHLELFSNTRLSVIKDQRIRAVMEDPGATYSAKVACFNLDSFNDWIKTMQDMIHAGQEEHLMRMIPNVGQGMYGELKK